MEVWRHGSSGRALSSNSSTAKKKERKKRTFKIINDNI
jgi:hypothetical protein